PPRRARINDYGRSGSSSLGHRQAQPGEQQCAMIGVALGQLVWHDQRCDRTQSGDNLARFLEPPHMGVARGEKTVWLGVSWMILKRYPQFRCRIVKPTFVEITHADHK